MCVHMCVETACVEAICLCVCTGVCRSRLCKQRVRTGVPAGGGTMLLHQQAEIAAGGQDV